MQCCSITDIAVKQIAKSCHKLGIHCISGCKGVIDLGIRIIARSRPKLKYLNA
jgi:hypothetical protein